MSKLTIYKNWNFDIKVTTIGNEIETTRNKFCTCWNGLLWHIKHEKKNNLKICIVKIIFDILMNIMQNLVILRTEFQVLLI